MQQTRSYEVQKNDAIQVKSKNWYIAGFVIGLILFIPSMIISLSHHLTGFEARIFYDINNLPNSFATFGRLISDALGSGYPVAVCVVLPLLFKRFRLSWRFFFTVGGAGIVMELLKRIVREPRPVIMLNHHLHERVAENGYNSFPSGHLTEATAMALIVWMILPKPWRWLPVVWILLVAVSRVYLGAHTPLDVIGGFGVGLMAVSFVQLLPYRVAKLLRLDNEKPLLAKGLDGLDIGGNHSNTNTVQKTGAASS